MKILVIAPEPFFTPRGTPFSVYYRTMVIRELGVETDLLTYGEGEDVDLSGARIVRIPRFQWLGPVRAGPSLKKLFLDVFLGLWAIGLLAKGRYEVVMAHEESVFFCALLKPIFRFKLVYEMHSSLPEQLRNFQFTESRLLIGAFRLMERLSLRTADAVVTVCPELGTHATSGMSDPARHFLIENSLFDDLRPPSGDVEEVDIPPMPDHRPIVMYAGSLEPYQGLDLLLQAFARVQAMLPEAFLVVIGGTAEQVEQYQESARRLGLDGHCQFVGRVSHATVKECISRASVLTSPRIEGTNTPLKIYEQVASGVPLVATRVLSHTQILDDRICFLVEPDPASMAEGLLAALDDDGRRDAVIAAARDHYHRNWSRQVYREKMRKLLEALA
ncbi:MAG TPA: glycosyltransferase family 4 protein [Gemmatimonadota bacterium]|nr:glycosyltransferase family 4 protein [Gemmatimonadota bacterium]